MLSSVVYSVSQVAEYLKQKLESDEVLSRLTVQGEVANLRTVASGHSYFSLREGSSVIRCVMFRSGSGREYLESGAEILAGGRFSFYDRGGEANMQVSVAVPVGAGALDLELARLRQELGAEGLFEPSRKRPLPSFPRVIGVVSSPDGAVWRDIQNVVRRRFPQAELRLSPTAVQGDGAPPQIAAAVARLNSEGIADVIIVARGGGSVEDLWCFNSEAVARAIFASVIPVISGVGHETDTTIADDVADHRAPTPSAAAELATPDRHQLEVSVAAHRQRAASALLGQLDRKRDNVELLRQRLQRNAPDVDRLRRQVDELTDRAGAAMTRRAERLQRELAAQQAKLVALDPAATLRRGYAIVSLDRQAGTLLSPDQAQDGDALTIRLSQGTLAATAGSHAGAVPSPEPASVASAESKDRKGGNPTAGGTGAPPKGDRRRHSATKGQSGMRPLL